MILKSPNATPVNYPPNVTDPSPDGAAIYRTVEREQRQLAQLAAAQADVAAELATLRAEVVPTFEPMVVPANFAPPRYSSHHLQQINNLFIQSKRRDEGLLLEHINTTFVSRDEQVYDSYVAYCRMIGESYDDYVADYPAYVERCKAKTKSEDRKPVPLQPRTEPRTIESWDEQREAQEIAREVKDVGLPYEVDDFVPVEKQLEASRRGQAKRPHFFNTMDTIEVGTKRAGFGHNKGDGTKEITRAVLADEDFSGYIGQNRKLGALEIRGIRGVDLPEVSPCLCHIKARRYGTPERCDICSIVGGRLQAVACNRDMDVSQLMCWGRGIDQPITFDAHVARSVAWPSLEDVNEYELTASMVQRRPFGYWAPFEYRPDLNVKAVKAGEPPAYMYEGYGLHKSLWCKTCVEHKVITITYRWDKTGKPLPAPVTEKITFNSRGMYVAQGHAKEIEPDTWAEQPCTIKSDEARWQWPYKAVRLEPNTYHVEDDREQVHRSYVDEFRREKRIRARRLYYLGLSPVDDLRFHAEREMEMTFSMRERRHARRGGSSRIRLWRAMNPTQWAVPVVVKPIPNTDHTPIWGWDAFSRECTHGVVLMLCRDCNKDHLDRCAQLPKKPRCGHVGKLSHVFADGKMILMCPGCTRFDTKRKAVLLVENIFQPNKEMLEFYRLFLNEEGLSIYAGLHESHLDYYAPSKLGEMYHAMAQKKLIGGKRVGLNSWIEDEDELWKEGAKGDYGVRDVRANAIVKQSRPDKKAATRDVRVAKWCPYSQCPRKGEPFIDRPNKKCCSENCKKRYSEERKRK